MTFGWRGRCAAIFVVALTALTVSTSVASASHFRGGQITWKRSATTPSQVDFQVTASFRRDGYVGTASDSFPAVGDVIDEDIGATFFDYGDGTATNQLQFKVVATVPAENYLIARALDPGSSTDTKLHHDYATAGGTWDGSSPVTPFFDSCCTIDDLLTNPSGDYRVETKVNFDTSTDTSSPNSSLQPIVNVGTVGTQTFGIPAVVPGGTTKRYRLATAAESCDGCTDPDPAGLTIDPTTGVVSWDTTGLVEGLYFASVVVESLDASSNLISTAQQTFLIRVSTEVDDSTAGFTTSPDDPGSYGVALGDDYPGADGTNPPAGSTFLTPPSNPFRLMVTATDATNPSAILHVDNLGLPDGATFTSTDGNPATGLVEWDPASNQVGDYIVTFTVSEVAGPPSPGRRARAGQHLNPRAGGINTRTISYTLHVDPDAVAPTTTPASLAGCTQSGDLAFNVVDNADGVGAQGLVTALDGGAAVLKPTSSDGNVTLAVPAEGAHTLSYFGRDLNGNASPTVTQSFMTDRSAPSLSIVSAQLSYTQGSTAQATVSASDPSGLASDPSGTVTLDTSKLGSFVLSRTAVDGCANAVSSDLRYTVTAAKDTTKPLLSKVSRKTNAFAATLSEPATLKITVSRRGTGRKKGKTCAKPSVALRKAKPCTLLTKIGTLTAKGKAGANAIAFKNKVGGKSLKAGSYQAVLTAKDAAGNVSAVSTVRFTVKKAKKS
jgi:hypothetical protein